MTLRQMHPSGPVVAPLLLVEIKEGHVHQVLAASRINPSKEFLGAPVTTVVRASLQRFGRQRLLNLAYILIELPPLSGMGQPSLASHRHQA